MLETTNITKQIKMYFEKQDILFPISKSYLVELKLQ